MQKNIFIAVIVCLFSMVSEARSIGGFVCDSLLNPLANVDCQIYEGDSLRAAVLSAPEGYFMTGTNSTGLMLMKFNKKGYNTVEIIIEPGNEDIDLGKIIMSDVNTLAELKVESSRVYQTRGKTLIFPSKADVDASNSSLNLLQKLPLPGLMVNPVNRSMSVRGAAPVILINGVPSSMDDVNALQPKDIEKIEYSDVTPIRYANRGTNGFISITLKKRDDGGQIYAYGRSAVTTAMVDANIRGSYHQGPSQFTLSYSPTWRNYQDVFDNSTQSYIGNDFTVDLESHDRNPFNYLGNNVSLRYEFVPSDRTVFSATFGVNPSTNNRRYIGNTLDSYAGDYDYTNLSKSKSLSPSLDLYFRHDFNALNSIEAQVVGTLGSEDYRRSNLYTYPDGSERDFRMDVDSRRKSLIAEVSYNHQFGSKFQWSAGYRNILSHSTNTYLDNDYKPVLSENNNYAYTSLAMMLPKFYLRLSTGVNFFYNKNDGEKHSYVRNITNLLAQWIINYKWNITATFDYVPSIPSLAALTDYPQQVSPYLWSNGNPNLKVAYNLGYSLRASYNYKKFMVMFGGRFYDNKNAVFSDMSYIGDGQFLSQTVNSKKCQVASGTVQLSLRDIYGFGANVSFSLSNYKSEVEAWSKSLTTCDIAMSLWWNKGPYTVQYYRYFPGKRLSGFMASEGEKMDQLSFDYKINRHLTVGASWMWMFSKKGSTYPAWNYSPVNPYTNDRNIKDNANTVLLNLTYNTDFGAIFKNTRRQSLQNKDSGSSLLKL